jgi:addiction module RelB/DinJ family antitoxin
VSLCEINEQGLTNVLNENIIKETMEILYMSKATYVHTRIDPMLKEHAEMVFGKLGLSLTEAISLFFKQVTLKDGLPFELVIPPTDEHYKAAKQALFEKQMIQLQADIQLGQEAIAQGDVLSADEARKLSQARLQHWKDKAESNPLS